MSSYVIVVSDFSHTFPSIFKNLADIPATVFKKSKAIGNQVIILAARTLDDYDSVIVAAVKGLRRRREIDSRILGKLFGGPRLANRAGEDDY